MHLDGTMRQKILEWGPMEKRSFIRPPARWTDDLVKTARSRWMQVSSRCHGHAGNQLGRPMFNSGQQQADMMMMMMMRYNLV